MKTLLFIIVIAGIVSCNSKSSQNQELKQKIKSNEYFAYTKQKALEVVKTGFNAGDGYGEVWIRDYNTFIELSAEVYPDSVLKENLLVFFRMQGGDGNIIDGFSPIEKVGEDTPDFSYSKLEPRYAAHKNTVETDQESSLVQAVYKYIGVTGDKTILDEIVGDKTVAERMNWAMDFLINERYNERYGLIIGATTADWGDVQPEHGWGVDLDNNTHKAIDIYDNAMFIIALNNLIEIIPSAKTKWEQTKNMIAENCMKYLWDEKNQKFIPHIYLDGSPFPDDFNEREIYYFGGTAIAIEAGLLNKKQIKASIDEMVKRVKMAGAPSIGLTIYPPYPAGYFANKIMNPEYSYQNGGDWTWFGGRMIQELIKNGFVEEAYREMQPMVKRVKDNDGFFEWYSVNNEPRGSGTFRGSAGVLYKAILMFEELE
jgi:glycogen debranching enzyme